MVAVAVSAGLGRRTRSWGALAGVALAFAAVTGVAVARASATTHGPVGVLAAGGASVVADLVVVSDPRVREGRFGDLWVLRGSVRRVTSSGEAWRTRATAVVVSSEDWAGIEYGARVRLRGRLVEASTPDVAGLLRASAAPEVLAPPGRLWRAAESVRSSVRRAAEPAPDEGAGLVPALVVGDESRLEAETVADFRTAGLTHLTAVSGTNLTLVLGALLLLGGLLRVSGPARVVLGVAGVVVFVVVARPEPSVLRAGAMGTVALLSFGSGARRAGPRALATAVLVLLFLDPWLGVTPGFALSVLATAGILLVAPGVRAALGWLPSWAALAVAVPLAAQVACTPLVASLSGEVSLVAVAANVLVAPAVGPATVLGLLGGLLGLVWPPLGAAPGWLAGLSAQWVVEVARVAARLPGASLDWPTDTAGLLVLAVLCSAGLLAGHRVLRHRRAALALAAVLAVALVVPAPAPGWPPSGWQVVACSVGQGDALVVNAGEGAALVVDAGPDPAAVDACLRRLRVDHVPVLALTHFHADHVDGVPGVLRGRTVGEIQTSSLPEPAEGARAVTQWAQENQIPVRVPTAGESVELGALRWQVLGPRASYPGSPNDSSLVLLLEAGGLRVLLTGDIEPPAQRALLRLPGVAPVDVVKVPHHGSRYQDGRMLSGLGARVALVSVGADNDYGHPAPSTLTALEHAGALVGRTDQDGDVAVVVDEGRLRLVTRLVTGRLTRRRRDGAGPQASVSARCGSLGGP